LKGHGHMCNDFVHFRDFVTVWELQHWKDMDICVMTLYISVVLSQFGNYSVERTWTFV